MNQIFTPGGRRQQQQQKICAIFCSMTEKVNIFDINFKAKSVSLFFPRNFIKKSFSTSNRPVYLASRGPGLPPTGAPLLSCVSPSLKAKNFQMSAQKLTESVRATVKKRGKKASAQGRKKGEKMERRNTKKKRCLERWRISKKYF